MNDLDNKYKKSHGGKSRAVLRTFSIVQRKTYNPPSSRPFGAWSVLFVCMLVFCSNLTRWERVWENGKMIGWWLVYHFDPDAECGEGDNGDSYYRSRDERFWPVGKGHPDW